MHQWNFHNWTFPPVDVEVVDIRNDQLLLQYETESRNALHKKTASGVNINKLVQIPRSTEQNAHNASEIRFATWNARAVRAKNKSASLCDYIISNQLDILAVTETWLTGSDKDNRVIADIQNTLPNYEIHHVNRKFRKGGGLAMIVRDGLKVTLNTTCDYKSMEYMDVRISSDSTEFHSSIPLTQILQLSRNASLI